ncbi:MAG: tetratricopeptide repeat protein [Fimbriimonadales bacterium]
MLTTLITIALLAAPAVQDEEILFPGTGPHVRPVVIQAGKAKQFFDQGLNFMYAFNHGEAKRSFRAAARHDPNSAMAWWGLAMANGPHINNMMVMPEEEQEASESLKKAIALISTARPVDRALIKATMVRFKHPQPADRGPLNKAFAVSMRKLWAQYPKDADIGALFAESLMDLSPWDTWTPAGKPRPGILEVVRTLEGVMKLNKNHPLALHLYIHAMEASPNPEKAKGVADRLRDLQPGLGHNVHMPSHLDVRIGAWRKAVTANAKAIAADKAYREQRPDQFIYRIYMAHNHHMLSFAAMMLGQKSKAIEAIDTMVAEMPEDFQEQAAPFVDGFFAMPFEVRKRFGMWDEVLALGEVPERFPLSRTLRRAARSVSYAAKGMPVEARAEQSMFYVLRPHIPKDGIFGQSRSTDIAAVAHHLMNGEILYAEGKSDAAIKELREAVRREDMLTYSEPPDWIQPTRHTLGAVLFQMKRYKEAEQVYRDDLKKLPHNGWSLYGLQSSLKAQGKPQSAAIEKEFKAAWADSEVKITSSCLCVPGR